MTDRAMADRQTEPETILQAGVVPFRERNGRIEFCLITSLKKGNWIFPKGIIDPGETLQETALKESFEEGGLHGRIVGKPLGTYTDSKWGCSLLVAMILLEVTRCEDDWPEADVRQRCWVSAEQAVKLVTKEPLRRFISTAAERIAANSV